MQAYWSAIANLAVVRMNYACFVDMLNPPLNRDVSAAIEMKLQ